MLRRYTFAVFIFVLLISCNKEKESRLFQTQKVRIDWMSALMEQYSEKEILFSELCLPGSHDAGMYNLRKCTFGANSCNTQTQQLDMFQQLEAGFRIFDVRPAFVRGEIFTQHATECGGLGCEGDYLREMLKMTNDFLEENKEVVILSLNHFCNISSNDTLLLNLIEETLGDKIYKETDFSENLYDWSLQKVLGKNPQKGKVILVFEGGFSNTTENRSNGYFSNNIMNFVGRWSNKKIYKELKEDQLKRYADFNPRSPNLFQFSYQMTPDEGIAIACAVGNQIGSIKNLSKQTNKDFPVVIDSLIQTGEIRADKIPNVFWLDYGDEWMIEIAHKISVIGIEK